jgi:hypothetical protein
MAKIRSLVIGGLAGAAVAYLFDPDLGAARRARLRDQLGAAGRTLQERALGPSVEPDAGSGEPADDLTVLSRVESVLYAMPGIPGGSLNLEVVGGRLVLRGEVESEALASRIVSAAAGVPGVASVESLLHTPGTPAPKKAPARRTTT